MRTTEPVRAIEPERTIEPERIAASMPGADASFDYEAAVLACARGERFALRALYDREARWLLGVALRIVQDRDCAQDVLQDAFLQIWQRAGTYDPALGSARGWIYTVVRHRALNEVRGGGRVVPLDPQQVVALSDAAQAEQAAHAGQAAHDRGDDRALDVERLERCLAQLDDARRRCVVHAFVDGYTHEQIAARLQTPLGTVKSWIRRSLASLKACLA